MNKLMKFSSAVVLIFLTAGTAWAQQGRYQGTYQSVRQLITRIENRTDVFRSSLNTGINRGRVGSARQQDDLSRLTSDFDNAVVRLRTRFERRQATTADVQEVLNLASQIDARVNQERLNMRAQNSWTRLRTDISGLAQVYGLTWSQDSSNYPSQPSYRANQLTGTFRLDSSRSDDPVEAANRAVRYLPAQERDRLRDRLTARLESPDQIAIDRRGRTITIASTRAPQITFEADGTQRIENAPGGRTIRATASLSGDQLTVSSAGDRASEFSVTFNPIENGQRLNVTRRVYSNELSSPIIVQSVYERTSDVARFDLYQSSPQYPSSSDTDFIVRDGETVVGELDQRLSTETAREGDRFNLVVRQPSNIAGAVIEGEVSSVERSGRLTGRSQMTLNFDRIRLRNGRSYRFAGIVESVRTPSGDVVKVDNEGAVREDSQTSRTTQRTAIGTAVGAIIGAIAGGGKGAAIGAIIGAGGGAGSVYVQGRDDLELQQGTELTIRASSPRQ